MWSKALWWKEYKQVKWLVWLFPVVHFVAVGLQRLDTWYLDDEERIRMQVQYITDATGAYSNGVMESTARVLLAVLLVVIGGLLVGAERRNGVQEMTFALPYSRQQLFWTKWMFGFSLIAGSVLLNSILDMIIMANSPVSEFFNLQYHLFQFVYTVFVLIAVYSTVLFIGAISGSMAAQTIFTGILAGLPIGFSLLLQQFLDVHNLERWTYTYYSSDVYSYGWYNPFNQFMENISLIKYLFVEMERENSYPILVPAVYALVSTVGGYAAFAWNRVENNGKLMLFRIGETVLKIGFVVCASLLGAAFLSSIFRNELISYYIGLLVSMVLSTILIRRLTRVRWKI